MKRFNSLFLVVLTILLLPAPYAYAEYIEGEVLVVLRDNAAVTSPSLSSNTVQRQSERTAAATDNFVRSVAGNAGAVPVRTYQALSRGGRGIVALLKSDSKTTAELMSELLDNPDVISVSPNHKIYARATTPNDEKFDYLWGLEMINAPDAWDITTGDADSYVAVLDSGIDTDHPDLAGNVDTTYSRDFTNESNINDGNGHGTHVSGIIGAVGDNNIGVSGVNWNTKIIMLKVLRKDGSGQLAWTIGAINYLVKLLDDEGDNLRIPAVNISYGGYDSKTPAEYVSSAEWTVFKKLDDTNETVVVMAAGNDGFEVGARALYNAKTKDKTIDKGDFGYPESMIGINNMIVVGSLGPTKQASYFSNWSSEYVHVAAPGGDSTINVNTIYSTLKNSGYGYMEGTSMAAPFVTGSIALLASSSSHKNLNASQLKKHLLDTSNAGVNPNSAAVMIDPPVKGLSITPQAASDTKISKHGLIDIGKAVKTTYDDAFVKVTGIRLAAPQTSLAAGKSMYIAAQIEPSNASDQALKWSSSDESAAAVDASGYVDILSERAVKITARSISSGVEGSIWINAVSKEAESGGGGCDTGIGAAIILLLAALSVKRGINSRKR
jgi:subtilisin family serine protease